MSFYQLYSLHRIILRRVVVLVVGALALPVMLFRNDRAKFYSYLHSAPYLVQDQHPTVLAGAGRGRTL